MQRPGWDRLCWEFTVSERAVHQTSATHLRSSDGFLRRITIRPSSEVAGDALTVAGGGDSEASGEEQQVVKGLCLPEWFKGLYELILIWEKKYIAMHWWIDIFTHPNLTYDQNCGDTKLVENWQCSRLKEHSVDLQNLKKIKYKIQKFKFLCQK